MSLQTIYQKLKKEIQNDYGVCGLMGNLKAESGLRSNNLQNVDNEKFHLTDEEYTKQVDDGTYPKDKFVNDKAGYGLAQWTFWSRKEKLYNFIKNRKVSIADEDAQVDYLIQELNTNYGTVLYTLKNAKSVEEASNAVLLDFEKPKNKTVENQKKRAAIGEELYKQLVGEKIQNGVVKSPLTNVVSLSPYNSGKRNHSIDRITPHCFVGQVTIERMAKSFASRPAGKEASCNYGIGVDGRVVLIVSEDERSWCSSSNANDQRAITFECASDSTKPYAFNTVVYDKLVDMCVDICKRYNKKKLLWIPDKDTALNYNPKSDEMLLTVHRWFANKSCPGEWMYSRMGDLASMVTNRLGGTVPFVPYKVRVTIDNLNIRIGPGTEYSSIGRSTGKGVFTIVDESAGTGSKTGWGKLKSGFGWISLDYVTRV